jgi:hypothetical protein
MSEVVLERESRRLGLLRMAVGLLQGVMLFALTETLKTRIWPGSAPVAYGALGGALIFAPLVLIGDLAAFRRSTLIVWTLAAAAIAAVLAGYDVWRDLGDAARQAPGRNPIPLSPALLVVIASGLFIGNHLLEASEIEGRALAAYPSYFEPVWKHAVQIALALLFAGVFWGLLFLGAALFDAIDIHVLADFIKEPAFAWPATTTAFAVAVHLTDVRVGLVRGVRTLALTLFAWLTPVLALLTGGFLLMLPFTGLHPLWNTKAAATILLSCASALILLLNAAYQDGSSAPSLVMRNTVRAAALILGPLALLAGIGVGLRIQAYGLTPQRILAAAWTAVAACYALGYAFAALTPGPWMRPLERTNIVVAWVILGLIAALYSPIADPARLSVADQVSRLARGLTRPETFDYGFLRFQTARFGRSALARLATRHGGEADHEIAARAGAAAKLAHSWERPSYRPKDLTGRFSVYPKGQALPPGFADQDWIKAGGAPQCLQQTCEAYLVDLDGDGQAEVLVNRFGALTAYHRGEDGLWRQIGAFATGGCEDISKALRSGNIRTVPALPHADLEVAGRRLAFNPAPNPVGCLGDAP